MAIIGRYIYIIVLAIALLTIPLASCDEPQPLPDENCWNILVDLDGSGTMVTRQVCSDPEVNDTDRDGLTDEEERQSRTDPSSADTDSDGISDYDEVKVYYSKPNTVDSDGDSRGNPNLFDYAEVARGTSPMLADTDGDGLDDYEEIVVRGVKYDPLVANIPILVVNYETPPHVYLVTEDTSEAQHTYGTEINDQETQTEQSARERRLQLKETHDVGGNIRVHWGAETKIGFELNPFKIVNASATIKWGWQIGASYKYQNVRENYQSWSTTHTSQAQQIYKEFNTAVSKQGEKAVGGRVTGGISLENAGSLSVTVSDIVVNVMTSDRFDPRNSIAVASLRPEMVGRLSLGPNEESNEIFINTETAMMNKTGVTLAQAALLSSGPVWFEISHMTLTDETGRDFTYTSEEVCSRTAGVVIDYGGTKPVERYMVATNVRRSLDGGFTGVALGDVLDYLGIPYQTSDGGELTRVRDVESVDNVTGVWIILSSSDSLDDESIPADEIMLQAGDTICLTYARDADNDWLLASEEYLFGTDDTERDTDGDGLTDYEEVVQGWVVPILGRTVFSNPLNGGDYDLDGLNDAKERAAQTDPMNYDTDADGIFDGDDPYPNNPSSAETGLRAALAPGSDTDVQLTWSIPSGVSGVVIFRQAGEDILARPENGKPYSRGDEIMDQSGNSAEAVYRGSGTAFTDTDLDYSVTYYYRIFTYDAAFNYGAGETEQVTTGAAPPPEVKLYEPVVDGRDVTLSWDMLPGIHGVIVLRSKDEIADRPARGTSYNQEQSVGASVVAYVGGTESEFTDLELDVDTQYYYRAFTYNQELSYSLGGMTCAARTSWYENDVKLSQIYGQGTGEPVTDYGAGTPSRITKIKVYYQAHMVRGIEVWHGGSESVKHGDTSSDFDTTEIYFEYPVSSVNYVRIDIAKKPDDKEFVVGLEFRTEEGDTFIFPDRSTSPAGADLVPSGWELQTIEYRNIVLLGFESYGEASVRAHEPKSMQAGAIAGLGLAYVPKEGFTGPVGEGQWRDSEGRVAVYSFYRKDYGCYIYYYGTYWTLAGWTYDGLAFYAVPAGTEPDVPVYRYYATEGGHKTSYHLSTSKSVDFGSAKDIWKLGEGVAFYAVPSGTEGCVLVYQYSASNTCTGHSARRYLYSTSPNISSGWTKDGAAFYAFPAYPQ